MNNPHYKAYQNWKRATLITLSLLLIILATLQAYAYYQNYILSKKVKLISGTEFTQDDSENKILIPVVEEIDQQILYKTLDALIEIMPPHAKIEKLEFDRETGLKLTCRAQNNETIIAFLNACAQTPILKNLKLKNSSQDNNSFVFLLQ